MFRLRSFWLAFAIAWCGFVPVSRAAVPSRIAAIGTRAVPVAGSVSPRAARASVLGEADGTATLDSMSLRFNMTDAQKAALTQLLIDQQNPASPRYHQWLTPEQFGDRFGLSAADMAKVAQWLTAQGFKITSMARGRTFIQFTGTVAQAQAAFQTNIHRVSLNGEEHLANVSAAMLPSGISAVVAGVTGLDDFKLKPRARVRKVQAAASQSGNPQFTSSVSGNTFIAPGDFYTIYDVSPLLSSSIDGTGVTIAVAGQTDISLSDVAAFRAASGLSANPPTVKLYGDDPGTTTLDIDEAQLDVEWSGAVAPSASILYVNSKNVIDTSLTQIIDNNLAPIASISYGDCESQTGQTELNTLNQLFMQANAQGQTIVGPSGDDGATDCDYKAQVATLGLAVDFPASSPYVTGVGGSMFNEGTGTYFGTTNNANGGSALSYIPEAVWNESGDAGITELSAGGGGVSAFFAKPVWQSGTGVPNDSARDVPDVSLNADPDHDGYLYCLQGSCTSGFRNGVNGTLSVVGGTSASTPAFAGILALVQQKIGSRMGNANPVIYALANSTYYNNVFHDIQLGNNNSPCQAGSTDCPAGTTSIGYPATVGYDLASGWGSLDAFNLANNWLLVTPVTGTTGTTASTTTVTADVLNVTSGTPVTVTATVATGQSDVNVTSIPTGTVQFLVDNVQAGAPVALASGIATFTLPTTSLAPGNHAVSATYTGDAMYAASRGSVTINITSATAPDFTLTPATTTVTVAAGADAPGIVYTTTPINGFTGPIAFTASTTSATLNATYSFSVTPLQITAPASGTTTLVLSAYVASAKPGTALLRKPIASAMNTPPTSGKPLWYTGSGAALAGVLLLMVPRRRRIKALLGVAVLATALGGMTGLEGCGNSSRIVATPEQVNAAPGTYVIYVTATGKSAGVQVTHSVPVNFVVQ